MTAALYHRKLARVLDRMGGLYTLNDILTAIAEGKMQSFAVGDTWCITQIIDFPRARQLQVVAMVGNIADGEAMHAKIMDYAAEINASLISAYGRKGWLQRAKDHGWKVKTTSYLYHLEM